SGGLLVGILRQCSLRKGVVAGRLLDRRFHQLGGSSEAQATQLLDHSDGLLARCRDVLARVDRLEHGRNLPHPGRGHVTEDIAVPVYDAPLPDSVWKELGALSVSPMQASEVISRMPFNPRSLRCLRNALQPALSSFAPSQMPRISR